MENPMQKIDTLNRIKEAGLLAVIRGPSAELTIKMVRALVQGGIKGIEITYSTPDAEKVVEKLADEYGDEICLGMGTLTKPEQVKEAKAAGAQFIVSPICEPVLVSHMVNSGLLVMAGALTPTEIFQAYSLGSDVVKVFPGSLTGPSYLKAIKGPFPYIPVMPTGGVNQSNMRDWFAAGAVAVGAGSELCPPALAKEGKFDEITLNASLFIKELKEIRTS
jgi:2-dehydro-3-deoxyphosphogluconate aldolase/(4S)-4-hydroxy-2-oxoglutarate aldolase